MTAIATELLVFAIQLAMFLIVPLVWYRVTRKRRGPDATQEMSPGFWTWLGVRRPARRGVLLALGCLALTLPLTVLAQSRVPHLRELLQSPSTPSGQLRRMGLSPSTIGVLLVAAVLKTGFTEEVFFRGFLAKRLVARLGLRTGNLLQALVFMAIHLPLLALVPAASRGVGLVSFVVVNTFTMAFLATWLNEKFGAGSIVPGWLIHGGGNVVAYAIAAFGS